MKFLCENRKRALFFAAAVIFISFASIAAISRGTFLEKNIDSPVTAKFEPSDSQALGQNFVIGIPGETLDAATAAFLKHVHPAGIVLYTRNYKSPEQLKALIVDLQGLALRTTGRVYFIMIDEEPGGATRLNLFQNVFAAGVPDWEQIASDVSTLKKFGINVDLAPVADFPFDKDSFITFRMPANTTSALIAFDDKFIPLLHANGIAATLKHFPGMGIFKTDPHRELPQANIDSEKLKQSLDIFQDGVNAGADFVMTGHAIYGNIDPSGPATLSSKIINDLLRGQINFKGLTITDDLSDMPFILNKKMDMVQATIAAIKNGQNLLIFSHKNENTLKIFDSVANLMKSDAEFRNAILDNYKKIISFKESKEIK